MITKMAPDLEMHDVEMIAEILKSVESQPGSGEIAVISLLTKTASLRADDVITFNEAAELAKMVSKQIQKFTHRNRTGKSVLIKLLAYLCRIKVRAVLRLILY